MIKVKKDCFAYQERKGKSHCHALTELDCENCKFYKERNKIKNNPYYAFSYKNIADHKNDIKKHHVKEENIIWD